MLIDNTGVFAFPEGPSMSSKIKSQPFNKPSYQTRKGFWREAIALQGSVTVKVIPSILVCGLLAIAVCGGVWLIRRVFDFSFNLDISLFGIAGGVLGILLVIRLNAGYDRWWEARTLWGGIVNQSRNLVVSAMAYGPNDPEWRDNLVRWTAVFSHAAHHSLRNEAPFAELDNLIGIENAKQLTAADHMPSFVALRIGELLREATERFDMDKFFYLQMDRERGLLLNHIGACERILTTPLPRIYSITIRRFILLFLIMLPIALVDQVDEGWLVPVITMFVAYPLLTLDQIGVELENPFLSSNLSHLPLNDLSAKIERNLFAVLRLKRAEAP
ncbi:bestrophin family protein [Gimesia chilikensis]|uniref:bestrophin family protein n=1 Tax=Gimesia chilikensis TaxID=2605989 RepID=UPI003A8DBA95